MKDKLSEIITRATLRKLAGDRSYQRGEEYFQDDRVHHLAYDDTMVVGEVAGTQLYHTRLNVKNGELSGHCSCPVWQGGDFCKHQVALGLAYLARDKEPQAQGKSTFSWKEFLNKCRREELVKIILEMTPNNPQIVEKYRMENLPSSRAVKLRELKNVADSLNWIAGRSIISGCLRFWRKRTMQRAKVKQRVIEDIMTIHASGAWKFCSTMVTRATPGRWGRERICPRNGG